ncbi:unnamed protein product [Amoebophrya sp. A25]|nr:unnamed protein product [Amoebophrya sp. A25]|eukprot:GSA25T00021528001.1
MKWLFPSIVLHQHFILDLLFVILNFASAQPQYADQEPPRFDLRDTKKYVDELLGDGKHDKAIHILRGLSSRDLDSAQRLAKIYMDLARYEEALALIRGDILRVGPDPGPNGGVAAGASIDAEVNASRHSGGAQQSRSTTSDEADATSEEDQHKRPDGEAGETEDTENAKMNDETSQAGDDAEEDEAEAGEGEAESKSERRRKNANLRAQREVEPEAWNNLGWAYERLDRLNDAVEAYIMATRIRPMVANYWFNLGTCLLKVGPQATHQGIASLEKALALSPNDAQIQANLGIATLNSDLLAKSQTSKAKQVLAQLQWSEGEFTEAVSSFGSAVLLSGGEDSDLAFQYVLAKYQTRHVMDHAGVPKRSELAAVDCEEVSGSQVELEVDKNPKNKDDVEEKKDAAISSKERQRRTFCDQQRRTARAFWRKEITKALALRKSADTLRYHDQIFDASIFAFLVRAPNVKKARKMRREESERLRPSVAQKIDFIRGQESDPDWQAKFALDCVDRMGQATPKRNANKDPKSLSASRKLADERELDTIDDEDEVASDDQDGKAATASAPVPSATPSSFELFPSTCGYGVIWATSWQRVHMRLEDGVLGEETDYRHITENWGVVVVGAGNGGGCAFAWLRKRECLAVDTLCDVFKHSGDIFFCRDPKVPSSRLVKPFRLKGNPNLMPIEDSSDKDTVPGDQHDGETRILQRGPRAGHPVKLNITDIGMFEPYIKWQDSATIAKLSNADASRQQLDPRYQRFVQLNKVGTVILQSFHWSAEAVESELRFWITMLPFSGDIFLLERDYQRHKKLVDAHFKLLHRHSMEVSWVSEDGQTKVEMLQLQKKIDKLKDAYDKKALEDVERMERRWREEKEEKNWRITQMAGGRGRRPATGGDQPSSNSAEKPREEDDDDDAEVGNEDGTYDWDEL